MSFLVLIKTKKKRELHSSHTLLSSVYISPPLCPPPPPPKTLHVQGALTDLSESLLGDVPAASSSSVEDAMEPAHFLGSDKRMRFDNMPNAHVAFAYKAPAAGSEHSVPMMMLQALLGTYLVYSI